jgi:hypothetical protein
MLSVSDLILIVSVIVTFAKALKTAVENGKLILTKGSYKLATAKKASPKKDTAKAKMAASFDREWMEQVKAFQRVPVVTRSISDGSSLSSCNTSLFSIDPTYHGTERMQERGIAKRQLQKVKKEVSKGNGQKEETRDGKQKLSYNGTVLITDASCSRVSTTYRRGRQQQHRDRLPTGEGSAKYTKKQLEALIEDDAALANLIGGDTATPVQWRKILGIRTGDDVPKKPIPSPKKKCNAKGRGRDKHA